MSTEQLNRFLTRLVTDHAFRLEVASQDISIAALTRSAARYGYEFSPQELMARARPLDETAWQAAALKFEATAKVDLPNNYVLFLEEVPMSNKAISAFLKKAMEDPALQKKLVELAAAEGFDFSPDELSDVDLDSIAGGAVFAKREDPTSNVSIKYTSPIVKPIIQVDR